MVRVNVLASSLVLVGCARAVSSPAGPPMGMRVAEAPAAVETFADPHRRAKLAAAFPALDEFLVEQRARGLPSLVFGVVIDGELAYHKALGTRDLEGRYPVDADTVYRIGSITKTFTGLALLKLRDEGKLSLDEPATTYLPELAAVKYPTRDSPPITLRQVLTHAAGLPALGGFNYAQSDHDVTEAEMLGGMSDVELVASPGMRSIYSNFGFGLLGVVVKRISGLRYRDYVGQAILAPLGMSQTFWTPADIPAQRLAAAHQHGPKGPREVPHWRLGEFEAAGGLYSSLRDMARYVAFQLAAYPPRNDADVATLRRSTVRESHTLQRPGDLRATVREVGKGGVSVVANAVGVGIAWRSRQTCEFEQMVGHAGGTEGYTAFVRMLPQRGIGFIALTNLQDAPLDVVVDGATEVLNQAGGMAPRTVAASPALTRAAVRGVALYNAFNESEYTDLFAAGFRAAFSPGRINELIDELKQSHGQCQPEGIAPLTVESPDVAVFSVPCQRGWFAYRVVVTAAGRIIEATAQSRQGPAKPAPEGRCPAPIPPTSR